MRTLFVSSPWSVVRCHLALAGILLGGLVMIYSSPAQEAPATGQEKKADEAPAKPGPGNPGMQNMMRKMMGGRSGGSMGMMGTMGQPAQPAQGAEPTLEEMLNKALKDNPDIRVADAKVREADAELNRTRLQVTQKVLAFHYSRESQKAVVKFAEENMARIRKLNEKVAISAEDVKIAEQQLSAAKAKLAEIEAEMPYLLGQQHGLQQHGLKVSSVAFSPDGKLIASASADGTVKLSQTGDSVSGPLWQEISLFDPATGQPSTGTLTIDLSRPVTIRDAKTGQQLGIKFNVEGHATSVTPPRSTREDATVTDKLRKALESPVTLDYKDKSLAEILEDLEKKVPGITFHAPLRDEFIGMTLKGQYPLKTALQLIEDTCSSNLTKFRFTFVVRDYGLLFCPEDKIPPGALRLQTFITGQYIPIEQFAPGPWRSPIIEKTPAKEDKSQETPKK
jgi:hypothetical protein